eukprot:7205000-Prymnesium_polylepis.1
MRRAVDWGPCADCDGETTTGGRVRESPPSYRVGPYSRHRKQYEKHISGATGAWEVNLCDCKYCGPAGSSW